MALIKCPECGTEVSDKAAACPKCAYPIQQAQEQKIVEMVLMLFLVRCLTTSVLFMTRTVMNWPVVDRVIPFLSNVKSR